MWHIFFNAMGSMGPTNEPQGSRLVSWLPPLQRIAFVFTIIYLLVLPFVMVSPKWLYVGAGWAMLGNTAVARLILYRHQPRLAAHIQVFGLQIGALAILVGGELGLHSTVALIMLLLLIGSYMLLGRSAAQGYLVVSLLAITWVYATQMWQQRALLVPNHLSLDFMIIVGSFLSTYALLTIALHELDEYTTAAHQRAQAAQAANDALQENTLLLVEAQSDLEQKVVERTAALNEALSTYRFTELRLREQSQLLEDIAKQGIYSDRDFLNSLNQILQTVARTLTVGRVGVWLLSHDKTVADCVTLYQLADDTHAEGGQITAAEYPAYFHAITTRRNLVAHNAHMDSRTHELCATYLLPLGITSLMDTAVQVGGYTVGILCLEHIGPARYWSAEEVQFASSMADLVALVLEMNERRKAAEAMRQAQKLESLGVLAGGVAHDFNNLLVAMLGQSSLALAKMPADNPAWPHVQKMVKAAKRAADLTRQILAYSGDGLFEARAIDLNHLIEENVHLFMSAVSKSVHLETDLHPDLPPIMGDVGQIQQVLMNLILNGAEAIGHKPGQVLVCTSTHLVTENDARYWEWTGEPVWPGMYTVLEVVDTGAGMTKEVVRRIFDPFFTTKVTGRGLGLAAVLGIVRGHRGGLIVHSQPDHGTTFRIFLPTADSTPTPVVPRTATPVFPQLNGQVLIIDDEQGVAETVRDMLEHDGFAVRVALNGRVGIEFLRLHTADIKVILLDLSMPDMSGQETFPHLRQIAPNTPIVLTSGYTQIEATTQFGSNGFAGFIQKPYEPATLINKIRAVWPT